MATTAKASEHIKPCNIAQSERHNRRDADYIASLNPARLYIRTELTRDNETYVAPGMEGITLQQHYDNIKALVKEKTGRAMQEKDVEYTDKKGVKRVRKGSSPIREGVVNIKPDTTMDDLLRYVNKVHEKWGITAIQIHMHKDEGHYENPEDKSTWQPNLHAHIIWDWIDHATGKSYKLNAEDMSEIQDMVAETLDMQRGLKKSETGLDHLERNDFILQKQENKKKQLQEEAQKAITEKEEAEAKVETAKAEVADLWKAHDLLTDSNRTKKERSNRLDFDIKTKTDRISKLDSWAESKLRDYYALKNNSNWQNPMFIGISMSLYHADEGLKFCIDAIQDFAFSGTNCRGGHHDSIFWDNESTAIKYYLKRFAEMVGTSIKNVAAWFVWIANSIAKFNPMELKRAHKEVDDVAEGKYDWRIQKYQQEMSR